MTLKTIMLKNKNQEKGVHVYVHTISFIGEPRKYRLLYSNKKQVSGGLEVEDGRRGL